MRFLRLDGPQGDASEAPGTELALPGGAVSSATWSTDGHLFALATQARPPPCCCPRGLRPGFCAARTCALTCCKVSNLNTQL